jgi:hypothetical protein
VNIFCVGGIPNLLCIGLYRACRGWFRNSRNGTTNISHLEDYASAHVANYFWVLVGILTFGVGLNIHPSVKSYVESVEKKAADIIKTPLMGRRVLNEGTPLLRKKFGDKPVLTKMGSMRAGPALSHTPANGDATAATATANHVKYSYIPRLYHQHEKQSHATREPNSTDETMVQSSPSRQGSM